MKERAGETPRVWIREVRRVGLHLVWLVGEWGREEKGGYSRGMKALRPRGTSGLRRVGLAEAMVGVGDVDGGGGDGELGWRLAVGS